MKYYAVRKGREPGIYTDWNTCQKQTSGFPNAEFKGFDNYEDALTFMHLNDNIEIYDTYAYTDGSFNPKTHIVGYGSILFHNSQKYYFQGFMGNSNHCNNVTGELQAVIETVKFCISKGIKELTIYHDYIGIAMWATNKWSANNLITITYREYMNSVRDKIKISFQKVKSHSGDLINQEVDLLAREATAGISSITWKEIFDDEQSRN